jgi:hypothetical protein
VLKHKITNTLRSEVSMGTFSQTNIKCRELEPVLTELKKYLSLGRQIWLDDSKWWFYNVRHDENSSDENNITIIASKNLSNDWIEVEFDLGGNLYVYDEVLRRISKTLETDILLGYYQSTTGEGRLAKFKNGQMELSYFEKYFYYKFNGDDSPPIDRIYIADNFGVTGSKIEAIKKCRLGEDSHLIDHDFIWEFYRSEGWISDLNKPYAECTYLHIEQFKTK